MEEKNQEDDIQINSFYKEPKKKPRLRRFAFGFWIALLIFILVGVGSALVYKTGFTFSQMNVKNIMLPLAGDEPTPAPDSDRINILVLGLRGENDVENGGLLTDSMMLLSIKKSTGQVALISIPRDLYVMMPGETDKEKINFAYALGFEKRQGAAGGLLYSKIAVSRVTGLNITYAVSVNFDAFKEMVDILGGIDVYLDKPFVEDQQWVKGGDAGPSSAFFIQTVTATTSSSTVIKSQKWVFEIPAGTTHLDGNTALYFTRARYSSNDFDRALRQQQVVLAIKNKTLSLGVLTNPVKIYQLLGSLGRNVRTDIGFNDLQNLSGFVQGINDKNIIHRSFDISPDGLLYQTTSQDGAYILLPVGDNFSKVQEACKNIFN